MGKGVFYMIGVETVIVGPEAVYGEFDAANPHGYADIERPDDFGRRYRDFVRDVRGRLPPSYRAAERWRDRESVVIAENRFYEVCVTGWEGDFYLSVAPREGFGETGGAHPLAVANLPRAAAAVFLRLWLAYPLRVRAGPWTTAPYRPSALAAAA